MEVEFLDKFNKDLDKISLKSVKNNLAKLIVSVESAKSINEIHQRWFQVANAKISTSIIVN